MSEYERLLIISNRISDWFCRNYPDSLKAGVREYRGWVLDRLNLRLEEDIFKLITLAVNWNTNISWEIGLATFEVFDEMDFLSIEYMMDANRVRETKRSMKSLNFKHLVEERIKQIQKRPYASTRRIHGGPRTEWIDAYHVAATNWKLVREWLKINEILKGRTPKVDGKKLIENLKRLFRVDTKGGTRRMLNVKTFLICREFQCQNIIEIETKYCCVPDSRVKEQLKTLGFPTFCSYYKNSETLANYFNKLYDLPIFYFNEECGKLKMKECKNCIVYDLCQNRYGRR